MKFREHRGGLKESMATTIEVRDKSELIAALENNSFMGNVADLYFEKYEDERTGWHDNYWVMVKFKGDNIYYPGGTTDGIFE